MRLVAIAVALLASFAVFAVIVAVSIHIARCVRWYEWTYVQPSSLYTHAVFCDDVPIPSVVYRTGKVAFEALDERVKQHYASTENFGYVTRYYSDAQCATHIRNHYDPRVLAAFHCLKPGAYKADLARLCLIYTFGGVYADFAAKFEAPIDGVFVDRAVDELVLVHDVVIGKLRPTRGIYNAVFAARAHHVFLKRCIDTIVSHVENRYYGNGPLEPTGPYMMWPVYAALTREFPNMPRRITACHRGGFQVYDIRSGKRIIHAKVRALRATLGGMHYSRMWRMRDIYCE